MALYSTFAGIYYSYNNPLISYYDYQDYVSNYGRSLTDGNIDTVDVDYDNGQNDSHPSTTHTTSWMHKTAHAMQFILNAIEKGKILEDRAKNQIKDSY